MKAVESQESKLEHRIRLSKSRVFLSIIGSIPLIDFLNICWCREFRGTILNRTRLILKIVKIEFGPDPWTGLTRIHRDNHVLNWPKPMTRTWWTTDPSEWIDRDEWIGPIQPKMALWNRVNPKWANRVDMIVGPRAESVSKVMEPMTSLTSCWFKQTGLLDLTCVHTPCSWAARGREPSRTWQCMLARGWTVVQHFPHSRGTCVGARASSQDV